MAKHDHHDGGGEHRVEPESGSPTVAGEAYKVGYGRPPAHGQFKPGCSGNTKGRPKGSRNAKTIVGKVLNGQITVRENGKARKATKLEAMIEAATHKAMKGDTPALNAVVALLIRTGHLDAPENEELATSLPKDDDAIIKDFLRRQIAGAAAPAASKAEDR
jgi:hypothetical protein